MSRLHFLPSFLRASFLPSRFQLAAPVSFFTQVGHPEVGRRRVSLHVQKKKLNLETRQAIAQFLVRIYLETRQAWPGGEFLSLETLLYLFSRFASSDFGAGRARLGVA